MLPFPLFTSSTRSLSDFPYPAIRLLDRHSLYLSTTLQSPICLDRFRSIQHARPSLHRSFTGSSSPTPIHSTNAPRTPSTHSWYHHHSRRRRRLRGFVLPLSERDPLTLECAFRSFRDVFGAPPCRVFLALRTVTFALSCKPRQLDYLPPYASFSADVPTHPNRTSDVRSSRQFRPLSNSLPWRQQSHGQFRRHRPPRFLRPHFLLRPRRCRFPPLIFLLPQQPILLDLVPETFLCPCAASAHGRGTPAPS